MFLFFYLLSSLAECGVVYEFRNVATGEHLRSTDSIYWHMNPVESYDNHDVYTIQNFNSTLCLDANHHDNIYTGSCNGGSFQKWILIPLSETRIKLRHLATLKLLADVWDKNSVKLYEMAEGTLDQWYLHSISLCPVESQ